MRKAERLVAFEGIDTDILTGNRKNKEIVKMFSKGMTYNEIAGVYGLTASRIGQILNRQARRAIAYKIHQNDHEYQALVKEYIEKLKREETIIISSDVDDKMNHLMALNEARLRIAAGVVGEDDHKMKAYIIKIEITHSEPPIWRRVIMPAGATFNRLHDVIQNITNFQSGSSFEDYHLFEFDLREENIRVTNDEEARLENLSLVVKKPIVLKIDDYLENYGVIKYTYDFGDNWELVIKLEEIVDDYYFGYPTLLDGAESAPPEDIGGLPGYYKFLETYRDEKHPNHEEVKAWSKEQGFREYDPDHINGMLKFIQYKKTEWDKINHQNYRIIEDKYRK